MPNEKATVYSKQCAEILVLARPILRHSIFISKPVIINIDTEVIPTPNSSNSIINTVITFRRTIYFDSLRLMDCIVETISIPQRLIKVFLIKMYDIHRDTTVLLFLLQSTDNNKTQLKLFHRNKPYDIQSRYVRNFFLANLAHHGKYTSFYKYFGKSAGQRHCELIVDALPSMKDGTSGDARVIFSKSMFGRNDSKTFVIPKYDFIIVIAMLMIEHRSPFIMLELLKNGIGRCSYPATMGSMIPLCLDSDIKGCGDEYQSTDPVFHLQLIYTPDY